MKGVTSSVSAGFVLQKLVFVLRRLLKAGSASISGVCILQSLGKAGGCSTEVDFVPHRLVKADTASGSDVHHDSQKIKNAINFIGPMVTRY